MYCTINYYEILGTFPKPERLGYKAPRGERASTDPHHGTPTANLRTKILDFRGFDSSRILSLMGGIPRPIGDFP